MCCGVDDDVGTQGAHGVGHGIGLGKVAAQLGAVMAQRGHLAQHGQAALQLPADLAVLAEEEDVHGGRW
jgi:hypothetical protein